jgi:hypothetical protein
MVRTDKKGLISSRNLLTDGVFDNLAINIKYTSVFNNFVGGFIIFHSCQ